MRDFFKRNNDFFKSLVYLLIGLICYFIGGTEGLVAFGVLYMFIY